MLKYIQNWWGYCKADFDNQKILLILDIENKKDEIIDYFSDNYKRNLFTVLYFDEINFDEMDSFDNYIVLSREYTDILRALVGHIDDIEKINVPFHDIKLSRINTTMYKDIFGNQIISYGNNDVNIRFKGWNSKITIGEGVTLSNMGEFNIGSNCKVVIGKGCSFAGHWSIRVEDNVSINIGDGAVLDDSSISIRSSLKIGKNFRTGKGLTIIAETNNPIEIGNDVLFSSDVHIRSGNGHSLFDLTTHENLSEKDLSIRLGNNVWIGQDVTIIGKTLIGDNCVVGAKSLLKMECGDKKLIYGNPAKIGRDEIDWDYRNSIDYEEFIGNN